MSRTRVTAIINLGPDARPEAEVVGDEAHVDIASGILLASGDPDALQALSEVLRKAAMDLRLLRTNAANGDAS